LVEHDWERRGAQLLGTSINGVFYPASPQSVKYKCKRCGLITWAHSEEDAEQREKLECDEVLMRNAIL
jgi:hypothetical protein